MIGKSNAEVVGTDTDVFDLPSGGGTSELQFQLKAEGLGAGQGDGRRTPGHGAERDAHAERHRREQADVGHRAG